MEIRLSAPLFQQASLVIIICCIPLLAGFGPPKLVESDSQRMPVYASQLPAIKQSGPPPVQARASLIMDSATGRVVYQRNATKRLAPASITKVMTAIVALENGNLTEAVTVRPEFLIEGSTMGLEVGDVLTLEDLLWGMMLPSANDAAYAIAYHVGGGSVSKFVAMMNRKAEALSLKDTHLDNPHGLDEEGHYSSAYDIAKMTRYALANPKFVEIVRTRLKELDRGRGYVLLNNNNLLDGGGALLGIDGVKTGFTDNAGDSIVASATIKGRRVIVVAMGTPGRDRAAASLIEYAFSSFGWAPVNSPFLASLQAQGNAAIPLSDVNPAVMLPQWQMPYVSLLPLAEQGITALFETPSLLAKDATQIARDQRADSGPSKKRQPPSKGNGVSRPGG